MARGNKVNSIQKTLKDYAVPLVGIVLILLLVFNVFSGGDEENTSEQKIDNIEIKNVDFGNGFEILKNSSDTKAYITYKNEKKVEIEDKVILSKGEKIQVENGNISIKNKDFSAKLSQAGEFEYKDDGSYLMTSGQLWIKAFNDIKIYTPFSIVNLKSGDVVNISQSMVQTDIYAINNNVGVSTLYGIDIELEAGNRLTIKAKDTNSSEFNAKENIQKIDSYFKLLPWFKENNGDTLLIKQGEKNNTNSGKTIESKKLNIRNLIEFDNLTDESYIKENPIKITGRFDNTRVGEITFNNKKANLNEGLGTFSVSLNLNNKVNDVVIKIFDFNKNKISKDVYTIYTSNGIEKATEISKPNSDLENYKVDATKFIIYEPTRTGKLTTTSGQITIRGKVLDKNIKSVLVNDYKLKSFNGTTWRYHAFTNQGTLKDGANLYEIKYLDKDGNVVYKEYYSIYKKINKESVQKVEQKVEGQEVKKISDEANLN